MTSTFYNRTRKSPSIPRKLLREGKFYLLPVYYLMLTSELAAEGIANSGSYRFADHIYGGKPAGKLGIGWLLDAIMLRMPSARGFKARYLYSKAEIHRLVEERGATATQLDILAVPSGLARELFEAADELKARSPHYSKVRWYGLDLDDELVARLQRMAEQSGHAMEFRHGDALDAGAYGRQYDMIICLGFAEFVDDDLLLDFYRLARERLKPGGRLVSSGMLAHKLSDYLLRNIGELHTHYRSAEQLRDLARRAGFGEGKTYRDATGLQAMLVAEKD